MAVYLFTLHGYGSWLPDRARGYTRRGKGVLPSDDVMAGYYREAMSGEEACFNQAAQRVIIEAVRDYTRIKDCFFYAVATDATHIHVLLGWRGYRPWVDARRGLKSTITRRLNHRIARRVWFARGGSRKRVSDPKHFRYLVEVYLPSHRGLTWVAPTRTA